MHVVRWAVRHQNCSKRLLDEKHHRPRLGEALVVRASRRRTAPRQWTQRRRCCLQEGLQWDVLAHACVAVSDARPSEDRPPGGQLQPTCTHQADTREKNLRENVLPCILGMSAPSVGRREIYIVPRSWYAVGRPGADACGIQGSLAWELLPRRPPSHHHRLDTSESVCAESIRLGRRFHLQYVEQAATATPVVS